MWALCDRDSDVIVEDGHRTCTMNSSIMRASGKYTSSVWEIWWVEISRSSWRRWAWTCSRVLVYAGVIVISCLIESVGSTVSCFGKGGEERDTKSGGTLRGNEHNRTKLPCFFYNSSSSFLSYPFSSRLVFSWSRICSVSTFAFVFVRFLLFSLLLSSFHIFVFVATFISSFIYIW